MEKTPKASRWKEGKEIVVSMDTLGIGTGDIDSGDTVSRFCRLNAGGEIADQQRLHTNTGSLKSHYRKPEDTSQGFRRHHCLGRQHAVRPGRVVSADSVSRRNLQPCCVRFYSNPSSIHMSKGHLAIEVAKRVPSGCMLKPRTALVVSGRSTLASSFDAPVATS